MGIDYEISECKPRLRSRCSGYWAAFYGTERVRSVFALGPLGFRGLGIGGLGFRVSYV